jgi:hypothetical protein
MLANASVKRMEHVVRVRREKSKKQGKKPEKKKKKKKKIQSKLNTQNRHLDSRTTTS